MRLLEELNPEQHEAAKHMDGPLLILAGAGSGKTRVIVYRIAHLLERGVAPESILAVSFTNRSVREMEERVAAMVNNKKIVKKLTLSTFHSLGVRILRREIHRLGYPSKFTIYDYGDQMALIRRIMREKRIDEKRVDPKEIQGMISTAKNTFLEPAQIADRTLREIFSAYDEGLRVCGAVDFDDLIRLPVRLLREEEMVREYWAGRFRQIMIDEYQDTNRAQLFMVDELASIHKNLCVVGDDDQSIYGWRGSDVENIRQFAKQYKGTKVVKLTQNYRCSGNILEAANRVIAKSPGRYDKKLWTEQDGGRKIGLTVLAKEEDESQFVAERIQNIQYDTKRPWAHFAVMYRTNAQSRSLEEMLRREKIPYRLVGGTNFFERKEIRDVVAYLKIINNPSDEIALRRILNYPARKIGPTTYDRISAYGKEKEITFYQSCCQSHANDAIGKSQKTSIQGFLNIIHSYQHSLKTTPSLSKWVRALVDELRLHSSLYKEYTELKEASKRIENLESLLNSVEQYEEKAENPALPDFLDGVSLDSSNEKEEDKDKDAVTLITLHGAKGLEFPIVFLVGLEEGFMPYYRRGEGIDNLEEERRLCYVGITRAKQELFLTRVVQRRRFGSRELRAASRFLEDIPKGVLRYIGSDGVEIGGTKSSKPKTEKERDKKFKNFFAEINSILDK